MMVRFSHLAVLAVASLSLACPGEDPPPGAASDHEVISTGERIDVKPHLAAEGFTVIEFAAEW